MCIGISGDGDTANIGLGQFKHACRRNLPMVYIVENNGCYGLTKGQFSATADLHAHLRRETGEENTDPAVRPLHGGDRRRAPRSWPGRSPATRSSSSPCSRPRSSTRGLAFLDIISPCVTFNDFDGSTKSWDWAKEHEEPLQEVGFVPRLPEIEVEQKAGETDPRAAPRRLLDRPPRPAPRGAQRHRAAARRCGSWIESQERDEFLTGLLYVDPEAARLPVATQNMVDTPLALLTEETLRPKPEVLAKIMETI